MSGGFVLHRVAIRLAVVLFVVSTQPLAVDAALADDCAISAECTATTRLEGLTRNQDLYREAMASSEFDEAEILAKRVMGISIIVHGRETINSANALTNLAIAQHGQEQFAVAKQNYQAAIRTIEQIDGVLSTDLIRPLKGMGETEMAQGNIELARESFQHAVHISHVDSGPRNPEQIEVLDAIAETYFLAGYTKGALDTQNNIFALNARATGSDNQEIIPALQHQAQWMSKLGLHNRARSSYLKVLRLQEKHLDQGDPNMIPTLITLARSPINFGRVPLDIGYVRRVVGREYYLNRAFSIATAQPQSNWELAANTALAVGDYYTLSNSFVRAKHAYVEAWRRLSSDPQGMVARPEQLGHPRLLRNPYLPQYYEDQSAVYAPADTDNFLHGTISAEFDVNRWGKSVNINLVESQPPGLKKIERRLVSTLRKMMYRPKMEDGARVVTRRQTYHYEFYYRD